MKKIDIEKNPTTRSLITEAILSFNRENPNAIEEFRFRNLLDKIPSETSLIAYAIYIGVNTDAVLAVPQ